MWAAAAALLAWNIWLTAGYESLKSGGSGGANETDGEVSVVDYTLNGYTTDITETAAKAASRVVSVTAVTENGEHIVSGIVYAVIGTDTWILSTCRSVQEEAEYVVRFDNGLSVPAELYGKDDLTDIAVYLTHPDFEAVPMEIGSSSILKQGEYVISLGGRNLHTQTGDVGFGVVSLPGSFYRSHTQEGEQTEWITQGILTDMPLTENNIGGAVLNLSGQAVGILSSAFSESRTGTSTAIAISEAVLAADEIRSTGEVTRGYLGIITRDVSDLELYQKAAMNISLDITSGIVIVEVIDDSPAQEAGLQANDVITAVDDSPLSGGDTMRRLLYTKEPGDTITLTVHRQGISNPYLVTLR